MNNRLALLAIISLFAVSLCASSYAQIVIIGFESLRRDDAEVHLWGQTYDESGFRFTADHPVPGNHKRFDTLGTLNPGFAGSTALYHGVSTGEITLSRPDGQAFNLYSLKLAEEPGLDTSGIPVNSGPFHVTFYGMRANTIAVTETVTVDSFLTLKPYSLTGFDHLDSVSWNQAPGNGSGPGTHQFDDVTVSAVPETSSLILLGSGTIPLLILLRHKKRRT